MSLYDKEMLLEAIEREVTAAEGTYTFESLAEHLGCQTSAVMNAVKTDLANVIVRSNDGRLHRRKRTRSTDA